LTELKLSNNQLKEIPESLGRLTQLETLEINENQLLKLPKSIGKLLLLSNLQFISNQITNLPGSFSNLRNLKLLAFGVNTLGNPLNELPSYFSTFEKLTILAIANLNLKNVPKWLGQLVNLKELHLNGNKLTDLPSSLAQLEHLETLKLDNNPLNPALQSAHRQGLEAVKAYLRSLEENAELLYEAKLVLVGEGDVGKTTLLKALKGKEGEAPKEGESTTHGVEIDIHGLHLPHPEKEGVQIQLNAWDFGGQEVYRVTHQFFFSRRSLYLLVWEPRMGVQQCQVEDWLNMIRLRVGNEARVIIISTHCETGKRIAQINKPDFLREYGEMIVGFHEVDSLVPDEKTGEMVGIAELKEMIAEESARLEQMGMGFNRNWKAARDELIAHPEPRISYGTFAEICGKHSLSEIDTETLAHLMHDLGYIVHYSEDEKLRDDVVLKPEWLTKAIGFVLEDRDTQDADGILLDERLFEVWHDHKFENEPRYTPDLYPFFLRLMEKYDVSYRLPDGRASLVAQHVPQVRPDLPWLPENEIPVDLRRIAMICTMEEDPPGLVPWMIVRTHDYATEHTNNDGENHRLHWQRGMFLRYSPHGEAFLEKRGRELHFYTQADWPQYFMTVLQDTLKKLIKDNWPGMEGRYRFTIPCPTIEEDGKQCTGRFNVKALQEFLAKGSGVFPCQECFQLHSISDLLMGFEERSLEEQLLELQREMRERFDGLDSRIANYFMSMMRAIADEAKHGPRLFTFRTRETGFSLEPLLSRPMELQLWCEAEGCQHPVIESGKGIYPIDIQHEWIKQIVPYANFALKVLATVAPIAAPAFNTFFGRDTTNNWDIDHQLVLTEAILGKLPVEIKKSDHAFEPGEMLSEPDHSGILALHRFLDQVDPSQSKLGLHRITTYTGDYRWLCRHHYEAWQPNIPDVIE
jgi:hypothetical protein